VGEGEEGVASHDHLHLPVLHKETGVGTASLFDECGQDFLIVNDVPTKLDEGDSRPRQ